MKADEIAVSLDKIVIVDGIKNESGLGTIIGYTAGWVEVEMRDMTVRKCRAKQLELVTEQEDVNTGLEGAPEEYTETTIKERSKNDEGNYEVHCPNCDHMWDTVKTDNYKCPSCGHMFIIRLHPDKDRYIIGLDITESGRDTMDIDDDIAGKLRGMSIEDVYDRVADTLCNNIEPSNWFSKANEKVYRSHLAPRVDEDAYETLLSFLWKKYSHLNLGMQRMNLGNLLRGAIKRNIKIDEES